MIYIVNGAPGSGKDTFCSKVIDITTSEYGIVFSTVDLVKEIAFDLGWNGEKTPKSRKFLSELKRILSEWDDIPMKDIERRVDGYLQYIRLNGLEEKETAIFIMSREPEEIKKMCNKFKAKSIVVRRSDKEQSIQSNSADQNVLNYNYDIEISNDGTLSDLSYKAIEFVEKEELHVQHWKNLKVDSFGNLCYSKGR